MTLKVFSEAVSVQALVYFGSGDEPVLKRAIERAVQEFAREYAEERMRAMRLLCADSARQAIQPELEGYGTRRAVGDAVLSTPFPEEKS